ncbi:MAG TPA: hypothetical protein PL130_06525 [Dictyoglomaceae bacterium]|nr:hypothetical protein [Dictyoglomaceae bacterium]
MIRRFPILKLLIVSILLIFLAGCVPGGTNGTVGLITWQRTYGGNYEDRANSIQQVADGGYIIAGYTLSLGTNGDAYIIKLKGDGSLDWERNFGGVYEDRANSIQQTADGGYIIAGYTSSGTGNHNIYIIKLKGDGSLDWEKNFGGAYEDRANSIQQTADEGYIIAGYTLSLGTNGDAYIIKLKGDGSLDWEKNFGGAYEDRANSIQQTADEGYIIAGYTLSLGTNGDAYIIKLKGDGSLDWEKNFGGVYEDRANCIQQVADGGYIVAGYTSSGTGNHNVYIIKLKGDGSLEWERSFGGENWTEANCIQETADGGYIVAGYIRSGTGDRNVYILKLDKDGNLNWERSFGGEDWEEASSIQQTADGGYITAGYTRSFGNGSYDVYVLKLNADGRL